MPKNRKRKKVLITGATSGIGRATAFQLAEEGYDLIFTGRRAERLDEIKKDLDERAPGIEIRTLVFDVRHQAEVEKALESLDDSSVVVLMNKARLTNGFSVITYVS